MAYAAERLMAAEVDGLCGAGHGERSPVRTNHRDGCRERAWDARAGRIDPKVPKLGRGSHFPALLEPRRTAARALAAVIREAYAHGSIGVGAPIDRRGRSMISRRRWASAASPGAR